MEHLEVGVAVSDELFHVIVLAFEWLWGFHEDRSDSQECGQFVHVPASHWSLSRWCPTGGPRDRVAIGVGVIRQCSRSSPLRSLL